MCAVTPFLFRGIFTAVCGPSGTFVEYKINVFPLFMKLGVANLTVAVSTESSAVCHGLNSRASLLFGRHYGGRESASEPSNHNCGREFW